jgi:adenosylmethionine-8-amino-7-oxononanoate aminotransferase
MSNSDLLQRSLNAVWHPCTQMQQHAAAADALPMVPIARGAGVWLYDFDGRRYLDGISSWWVNLFGHCHPRINAALREQLEATGARHPRRFHASAGDRTVRAPVGA